MHTFLVYLLLLIGCRPYKPEYRVHTTTPGKISFHFKVNGQRIGTLQRLSEMDTTIRFAMNGCMYTSPDYMSPGLYIEKGKLVHKLVLYNNPSGNFGISQGVFFIDKKGAAGIVEAAKAKTGDYYYAVELAPLLLINGQENPRIRDMKKAYTRNGIGITKEGKVVLVEAVRVVSMHKFALKFQSLGCTWAAYVDGAVSESWVKGESNYSSGQFGVMIAAH